MADTENLENEIEIVLDNEAPTTEPEKPVDSKPEGGQIALDLGKESQEEAIVLDGDEPVNQTDTQEQVSAKTERNRQRRLENKAKKEYYRLQEQRRLLEMEQANVLLRRELDELRRGLVQTRASNIEDKISDVDAYIDRAEDDLSAAIVNSDQQAVKALRKEISEANRIKYELELAQQKNAWQQQAQPQAQPQAAQADAERRAHLLAQKFTELNPWVNSADREEMGLLDTYANSLLLSGLTRDNPKFWEAVDSYSKNIFAYRYEDDTQENNVTPLKRPAAPAKVPVGSAGVNGGNVATIKRRISVQDAENQLTKDQRLGLEALRSKGNFTKQDLDRYLVSCLKVNERGIKHG